MGPCKLPASQTRPVMQAGPMLTAAIPRQNVRAPIQRWPDLAACSASFRISRKTGRPIAVTNGPTAVQ
jgi:hypothetical protein